MKWSACSAVAVAQPAAVIALMSWSKAIKVRYTTVEHTLAECAWLSAEIKPSYVMMRDPVFAHDPARVHALCEGLIARGIQIRWGCESRPEHFDPELLRLMKAAGCVDVKIGMESGDPDLLAGSAGWQHRRTRPNTWSRCAESLPLRGSRAMLRCSSWPVCRALPRIPPPAPSPRWPRTCHLKPSSTPGRIILSPAYRSLACLHPRHLSSWLSSAWRTIPLSHFWLRKRQAIYRRGSTTSQHSGTLERLDTPSR